MLVPHSGATTNSPTRATSSVLNMVGIVAPMPAKSKGRQRGGMPRRRDVTDEERRTTAYEESGTLLMFPVCVKDVRDAVSMGSEDRSDSDADK